MYYYHLIKLIHILDEKYLLLLLLLSELFLFKEDDVCDGELLFVFDIDAEFEQEFGLLE